jgi:hypothetical protein
MSVEADEIWAILREVAAEQKALQESQKESIPPVVRVLQ